MKNRYGWEILYNDLILKFKLSNIPELKYFYFNFDIYIEYPSWNIHDVCYITFNKHNNKTGFIYMINWFKK